MRSYIKTREEEIIRDKISATASLVANNDSIKEALENKDKSLYIQNFTKQAMHDTGTDFIVVTDKDFNRYSHPSETLIGEKFSNLEDIGETFTKGNHYSKQTGTLGDGLRYFQAIKDKDGNNIGVVCVGYTKKTVENQLLKAQEVLFFAFVIGLGVALVIATIFYRQLKKILLNYRPEEIAQSYMERELISDHISEGIIGIDINKKIIVKNTSANQLLKKAKLPRVKKGEVMPDSLYELLFKNILETHKVTHNEQILLNSVDLLLNTNPIYNDGKLYGAVVTLRDESEMKKLITELSGTEKYNDSLREQSHNFMNKLHVLQGLIELKSYDEVEKYITYLKDDYHEKIGHITDNIKVPSIAGLLLAKSREAARKGTTLKVDNDSYIEQNKKLENLYNELLIILGILIDNSLDALENREDGKICLYLYLNVDESILLCTVSDNGVGIRKDTQEKMFERGYSTKGTNRGYGLDTVASIVEKYRGLIEVESEEGKGTKIIIEIPTEDE